MQHREVIDPDGTAFHQFTFAIDGVPSKSWEIPKYHRLRFSTEDEFEAYLARTAVSFAASEYNVEAP